MKERKVDQSALKVNQAWIIGLLLLAYVLDAVWLVAVVGTTVTAILLDHPESEPYPPNGAY